VILVPRSARLLEVLGDRTPELRRNAVERAAVFHRAGVNLGSNVSCAAQPPAEIWMTDFAAPFLAGNVVNGFGLLRNRSPKFEAQPANRADERKSPAIGRQTWSRELPAVSHGFAHKIVINCSVFDPISPGFIHGDAHHF